MPFEKGHQKIGGRRRGTPNKATLELKEWAREMLHDPEWRASARARIIAGKAPHLENHLLSVLMPKTERLEHRGMTLEELVAGSYTQEEAQ